MFFHTFVATNMRIYGLPTTSTKHWLPWMGFPCSVVEHKLVSSPRFAATAPVMFKPPDPGDVRKASRPDDRADSAGSSSKWLSFSPYPLRGDSSYLFKKIHFGLLVSATSYLSYYQKRLDKYYTICKCFFLKSTTFQYRWSKIILAVETQRAWSVKINVPPHLCNGTYCNWWICRTTFVWVTFRYKD